MQGKEGRSVRAWMTAVLWAFQTPLEQMTELLSARSPDELEATEPHAHLTYALSTERLITKETMIQEQLLGEIYRNVTLDGGVTVMRLNIEYTTQLPAGQLRPSQCPAHGTHFCLLYILSRNPLNTSRLNLTLPVSTSACTRPPHTLHTGSEYRALRKAS